MPNIISTRPASSPSAKRSVWGCMTCRRRKVKCLSRDTPCASCRRLKLECVPSFGRNFKQWKRERQSAPGTLQLAEMAHITPPSVQANDADKDLHDAGHVNDHANQDNSVNNGSTEIFNDAGDIFMALAQGSDWDDVELPFQYAVPRPELTANTALYPPSFLDSLDLSVTSEKTDNRLLLSGMDILLDDPTIPPPSVPCHSHMGTAADAAPSWTSDVAPIDYSVMHSPFASAPLAYGDTPTSNTDRSLVAYYKHNLASFFSVKSAFSSTPTASPWSFYAYAIRAAERQPDSPLCHSILAWTSAHLLLRSSQARKLDGVGDHALNHALNHALDNALQVRHYARARAAANDLQLDLQSGGGTALVPAPPPSTGRLRMLLATTLFLAYGDVLSGDGARLVHALGGIAQLLASDWPRFRAALGPVEARILIWLAYLDLRSSLWTPRLARQGRGLFRFLQDHVSGSSASGIAALRGHGPQHYYLVECFAAFPPHELQDDLLQEPAKRLSDEIMGVYATIADLEVWIEEVGAGNTTLVGTQIDQADMCTSPRASLRTALVSEDACDTSGDDLTELRIAKIHAVRATLTRIRAEAKVVHTQLLRTASCAGHVARTEFHRRVTTAMGHAATILLNRVERPDIRTDEEAQAAARDIVQIARELRQAGCTAPGGAYGCPRSLVWPMPVFVAGIEVTDPVYQDWVLVYLDDVAGWGTSIRRARELLRRVIERQEEEGRRVKVQDILGAMGNSVLI